MIAFIIRDVNEAHVTVDVRLGARPAHRPLAGTLVFYRHEWTEFAEALDQAAAHGAMVRIEGKRP